MPILHEHDKYVYDAIINGLNNKENYIPGPTFIWDDTEKIYKYSNSLYPNKQYKKIFDPKSFMKRGDVIHFGNDEYRNNDKMIFNGENIEYLYTEVDDYGSVPLNYVCGDSPDEFDIGDFENIINHNSINWLSKEKLKEIIFDIDIDENNDKVLGSVSIKGTEWKIILDIYYHSEFENSSTNSKKFICYIDDGDIYINKIKDIPIRNQTYLIKSKADSDSLQLSKLVEENQNLSFVHFYNRFINPPCSEWIAYRTLKKYKFSLDTANNFVFPLILKKKTGYSYDCYIINKEEFDRMIEIYKKDLDNIIIKEIIGYPVTVELLEKDNEILLKEIKEHIQYIIENDIDIPFSQEGSNVLSLSL